MSDKSQRTEKPTPRRLQKAREEGRFLSSKEAVSAVTLTASVIILIQLFPQWMDLWTTHTRFFIQQAFTQEISIREAVGLWQTLILEGLLPLLLWGIPVVLAGLFIQLVITRFGIATSRLKPELNRLNPLQKIKQLPGQNLFSAAQSIVLLGLLSLIVFLQMPEWFRTMQVLPLRPLHSALQTVAMSLQDLLWKALALFLLIGTIDFIRQKMKFAQELRMTRQEIRDEFKESEGNPLIKQRIRRIQRDASQRRMMEKVPAATAVIVNPTHYSVAIHYDLGSMAAPRVVAKGKNYIARRIRETAIAHNVPIVENPPLARSLYKSVDVGKEIPAAFYRAVAEILAYIYRLMNGRSI